MRGLLNVLSLFGGNSQKEREKRIERLKDNLGVAVLNLEGVIASNSEEGTHYRYLMESLAELSEIGPKALVLRINSPGGTTGASEEIYRTIMALKKRCGTRVVVSMEDVCASGGLYVAMAGDRILTKAGTLTGSIGVIIQGVDYVDVLRFLKVKSRTIKSGKYKDILSPTREMLPEEEALLKELVLDVHAQFVNVVAKSRRLKVSEVGAFADGRIMTGAMALSYGLADKLGGFDDALAEAVALSNSNKPMKFQVEVWGGPKKDLLSKVGLSSQVSVLDDFAMSVRLSGMPLWIMPRF